MTNPCILCNTSTISVASFTPPSNQGYKYKVYFVAICTDCQKNSLPETLKKIGDIIYATEDGEGRVDA